MATWPTSLPAPLIDGYGIEPAEQTVATDMEVGTQRVRRRSFAQVDHVRMAVSLTDAQMAIFRGWFYSTDGADGGAGWFTISLWVGRGGGESIKAKFRGTPKWDMTGNHRWIVTGQLETRPYTGQWWDYFAAAEIPSLDLNFAEGLYSYFDGMRTQAPSDPFADFITFTRTTTATYIGADGLLKTAAIDEPRIEYDPVTGECKGLLIEESRTNLSVYSEQFDVSGWIKVNASISANAVIAPNGELTADKLVEDTTAASKHLTRRSISLNPSTTYAYSMYVKAAERTQVSIECYSSGFWVSTFKVIVNLLDGSFLLPSGGSAAVTHVGGGWYRVSFALATDSSINTRTIWIHSVVDGNTYYDGDGTSGIYIWGAQLEEGAFSTSYIKTEDSVVTRGADNVAIDGDNYSSWNRAGSGAVLVDFKISNEPVESTMFRYVLQFVNTNSDNQILVYRRGTDGTLRTAMTTGGVSQAFLNCGWWASGRLAFAWDANGIAEKFNEHSLAEDTTVIIPVITRVMIGQRYVGGSVLNGHISRLVYWPKRLTNTQLQELTA